VASRLQELTKLYQCQLIMSQPVATQAGLDVTRFPRHELTVRNRTDPIAICAVGNVEWLALSGA